MSVIDGEALNQCMDRIMHRMRQLKSSPEIAEIDDKHWEICNSLCDEFNLWDNDRFPTWLMHVVSGYLRDPEA